MSIIILDFRNCSGYTFEAFYAAPMMSELDKQRITEKLDELRTEHRDLDEALLRLNEGPNNDMLAMQRMKKRKLVLKDMIAKLESMLIDDIIA